MTTLQSVPPAQEQRPKKTFPELVQAIYEDPRVGHEARELLLAVAYAVDLAKREDGISPLRIARQKLGVHGWQARYDRLIADDAPRYEVPYQAQERSGLGPGCEAPRLRPYQPRVSKPPEPDPTAPVPIRPDPIPREIALVAEHLGAGAPYSPPRDHRNELRICGAGSHHRVLEKDPRTGWVTAYWFCRRHKAHADRVAEQVRAQNETAPEPIPNRGGLLPCYFKADWAKVYQHYLPRWTVPSYGISADDWPRPDTVTRPVRGRLRVISDVQVDA